MLPVDTLRYCENKGIALAGPQVGFNKRIFIAACARENWRRGLDKKVSLKLKKLEVFINPEMFYSKEQEVVEEECLSYEVGYLFDK